ncbi:response regulator [Cellvibrio sp. UBA7661]|uniref:response regulator n=1 Tax=Cellvibrio sp. UBA7661 TaxID=1946311 RepID=UPI002F35FB67
MNILIVEDEIDLGEILQDYLASENYNTTLISDGEQALQKILTEKWDLILLDLMLPKRDGLSICQEVRKTSQVPIIMTTAKVEEIDRLIGLELGADDYICKPFSPREVVARVKAVLRRSSKTDEQHEEGLRLDKERQYACVGEQCVELTSIEFRILETLLLNKQRVISRDLLLKNAYTDHRVVSDRTMDSHITKLRKKLQPICKEDMIHSVYGVGYRLQIS